MKPHETPNDGEPFDEQGNEPLNELSALWRDLEAPSVVGPEELGQADPLTRAAIDWVRRAMHASVPPATSETSRNTADGTFQSPHTARDETLQVLQGGNDATAAPGTSAETPEEPSVAWLRAAIAATTPPAPPAPPLRRPTPAWRFPRRAAGVAAVLVALAYVTSQWAPAPHEEPVVTAEAPPETPPETSAEPQAALDAETPPVGLAAKLTSGALELRSGPVRLTLLTSNDS